MKLFNLSDIAERWKAQYWDDKNWKNWKFLDISHGFTRSTDSRLIYDQLATLGVNSKAEDIDRIIGNNSWTTIYCDECGKQGTKAVLIAGQEICFDCIDRAARMVSFEKLKEDMKS